MEDGERERKRRLKCERRREKEEGWRDEKDASWLSGKASHPMEDSVGIQSNGASADAQE